MKYQKKFTSNGKFIEIYDDVLTSSEKIVNLLFAQQRSYNLSSSSTDVLWQKSDAFFVSPIDEEDLKSFEFLNTNFYKNILMKNYKNYKVERSWFLSSSPFSTYYFHVDTSENSKKITLLYYLNTRWDRNWGGETLFANNDGECEIAVEYKPGRIVIFDGSIEHKPSPISIKADEHRFSFVIQFTPNKSQTYET